MKRCPTCDRTFEDTLSFCLEDGTPLVPASSGPDSEATLVSPKSDLPPTQAYSPMPAGSAWPYQARSPYPATPSPQRKVWPWVLAVAAVFLIGVIAIVVVAIVLPGLLHPSNDNRPTPGLSPFATASPKASPSPSPSPTIEVSDVPTDSEEVQTQLENLENEWERANVEADKNVLNRILATEYQGDGQDKKKYLSTIQPRPGRTWRYRNFDLDLDGETATLTYDLDRIDGDNVQTSSYVDTFVWRDHRWQATSSHEQK
jgi:hypothetical protein